jgi:hypothetical protein
MMVPIRSRRLEVGARAAKKNTMKKNTGLLRR